MPNKTELTVLSYGGGQDSWTLLLRYVNDPDFRETYAPGRFLVVMADTQDEHPATLEHVEYTKTFCADHGIEFVHITPDMGHHLATWQGLREFYRANNAIGSKRYPKSCTDKLKLRPIYDYLEQWLGREYGVKVGRKAGFVEFAEKHGKINMLIGIARREEKRCSDPTKDPLKWRRQSINTLYPLIDLGMDRADCQQYMKDLDQPVCAPSNCILCPFMSKIELLWLVRFLPQDYHDWVELEAAKLEHWSHLGERNLGVWGEKALPQVLIEAQTEHGHMTDEDLQEYKMSHGHCVMSKY